MSLEEIIEARFLKKPSESKIVLFLGRSEGQKLRLV